MQQQYRVNYSVLIGLLVGTLVCSGAVYGLWRFQIERKSGALINEAEKAREAGDNREAVRYYWQYLTIHGQDDDARLKYAGVNADLAEQEDVTGPEFTTAQQTLETTVRDSTLGDLPETKKLRTRLAKLYGRVRRYQAALGHLDILLEQDPNDAELQVLRATYLVLAADYDKAIDYSYKLVGYDVEADSFDAEKATAPHATEVYSNLAALVRSKRESPELADRIMDQLIEVNPDSAEAYLARGSFRLATENTEGGTADIEKAYQLEPDNPDVLLAMAGQALQAKQYDKAREYLDAGKKLHPEDARFYQSAAEVETKRKDYAAAMAQIDEGLKSLGSQKASMLLILKADLQLQSGDHQGVQQTIEDMKRTGFRAEFVDWYEARILLAESKWFQAVKALNLLRPKVASGFGPLSLDIDNYLGLCYERLGRLELARDQYELVLQQDPKNEPAMLGKQRVGAMLGLESAGAADPLSQALADELKKPKDQQDWARLDAMLKGIAEKRQMKDADFKLLQANVRMMQENFDEAGRLLAEANNLSPHSLPVHRMKVQLDRLNPKLGPDQALNTWNKVVAEFGDKALLRLDKADILIAMKNEDRKPQLASLLAGVDSWSVPEKVLLWSGMAQRYLSLGMTDEARQYLALAADNQPDELQPRLALFTLALDASDDAGMKEAQDKILQVVKSQDDSTWLYTEARRKLSLVRRGQLGRDQLDEIRSLVSRALQQRPEWHELYLVNAELELLAGNAALALKHYDEAEKLGRPYPGAVAQHIRLLAASGRFADAGKLLDRLPESLRQTMLGQLYPEILFRTNQVESALKQARTATENNPTNAQNHYWYSQLLARSAQVPGISAEQRTEVVNQAIQAMQRAVELEPEFPEAWYALISYHGLQENLDLAQNTLREAQLALNGDNLQMFLAKCYEALGRWFDAETFYRSVYEAAPEELPRAQQLAAFYLGPAYQRPDRQLKATPLINRILRAGAEGKLPANDPNLLWARRMGAKMLAASGDYQSLIKAQNLLTSSSRDGSLAIEDKLELANILAPRPEPESRNNAVQLLEEVSELQPLNEHAEIVLGELYFALGEWQKYVRQMEKTIARFPNSLSAREAYVRKLLSRTDQQSTTKATAHVSKLRQLAPNSSTTFELSVRLADKVGKQQQVRAELLRLLSNLQGAKELNDQQVRMLALFASLLVELDDLDSAEKIYRDLADRDSSRTYALAIFLGTHRDVAQCFDKLNEIYSAERIPEILGVAMTVVREQRDKVGEKFDPEMQRWLDAGLRENPDSITLLLVQADLYDLQKKYDEAAAVYRKLLSRHELIGLRRAVVLNNLSYLAALAGSAAAPDVDALQLVQEAAQILGPNSDILDTRAVVLTARKQYQQAIQDIDLSVTDNPTASKYFHKADAHLRAGENRAAVEAWTKAEQLGLSRDVLNRMEHERYEEMKKQIDQIRGGGPSVTQSEPLRRAG